MHTRIAVNVILLSSLTVEGRVQRIVGGTTAVAGEFPFWVSMEHGLNPSPACGASLITDQWVLSAAHCCVEPDGTVCKPSDWRLRVRAFEFTASADNQDIFRTVKGLVNHENYDTTTNANDITLVKYVRR